ncbi:MAG: phage head morphogenesis protein [Flavobacteriales bacterium]|nr:phage head morphogenesis protein [Flavobacteriales bacterium]
MLAKEWADALKDIYRNKGNDGSVNKPLVTKMGKELMKPIDREFPIGIDYDSPDYAFRENLKRNVWNFSVAKNYNDCLRLSNLLLRPDGSLRPWNEFKKEAHFVVGTSNRYLKTEYDTIVAGAQMSRLWQEIQRDKHIFPFVQLKVTMDGHTSEICSPLHNLIFAVDDPVLEYYFPPNHFNCRTYAIKLRNGPASDNFTLPEIPEAFQNNVGATGQIFTEKNAYIENTPEEVFEDFAKFQRKEKDKELKEWAATQIKRGEALVKNREQTEIRVSRSSMESVMKHISSIERKEIIKDMMTLFDDMIYSRSMPLDLSKSSKNLGKKIARGVTSYKYYVAKWNGLDVEIVMEVMKNGYEQPYAVNFKK